MATTTGAPPLKEQAFQALRALILNGDLPAGTFVSERQLVVQLEMSKTPIRVALERLERDGFVEILAQRGVRVRELTDAEIADHYELRGAVETWAVRRAAERRTPEDVAALRAHVTALEAIRARIERQADATSADDVTAWVEEDAALHQRLASIAGNSEVERVLRNQRERLARVIAAIIHRDRPLLGGSIEEHRRIVEAVAAGDGDTAAAELADHLKRGMASLLARPS